MRKLKTRNRKKKKKKNGGKRKKEKNGKRKEAKDLSRTGGKRGEEKRNKRLSLIFVGHHYQSTALRVQVEQEKRATTHRHDWTDVWLFQKATRDTKRIQ